MAISLINFLNHHHFINPLIQLIRLETEIKTALREVATVDKEEKVCVLESILGCF